jgi:S-DNA-T family DNA segregation ATPase FtsK/SpoIIIE
MATKKQTKPKKTSTRRKKPAARKGKSPARKAPARKAPARKRQTTTSRSKSPSKTISTGLSLDRKLDIIGVGTALIGLLTLLSVISSSRSSLTGAWVSFLERSLGWGLFLVPLGLIAFGLWLILRHFERVPQVSLERILGVLLLYTGFLVFLHALLSPDQSFTPAEAPQGGGYLGAALLSVLKSALGSWGAGIALFAWLLIGLAMAFDVSVADLFRWLPPLADRLRTRGAAWLVKRREVAAANGTAGLQEIPAPLPANSQAAPPETQPQLLQPIPNLATEIQDWTLPPIDQILERGGEIAFDDEYDRQRARLIAETLASFGAPSKIVEINRGPTITQFGVEPDFIETNRGRTRVRVGKIASLADDLALALAASRIRVQAPVPGKGFVGIEVPNDEIAMVALRDVIESQAFLRLKSPLRFALGQNVSGNAVAADLAAMPHLLIAGATGSGKSVAVNALISCLLLHNTPQDLRLLMVDPKRVELTGYNGIPHLLAPVVVELDRVVGSLQWVAREMDQRYHKLAKAGERHINDYNSRLIDRGEPHLPHLVVIIDELADLMMLAPDETERTITRLAQLARATGIHLVISTQRPSVDVVTGLIKANFPARIAFAVASGVDSRVILDQPGAERLLGSGDMLFQAPDAAAPVRLQGVFVSDSEITQLVMYWRGLSGTADAGQPEVRGAVDALPAGIPLKQMPMFEEIDLEPEEEKDPLLDEATDLIRREGRASISMLQRRLRIGYTRAARLIENLEARGIVSGPAPGGQAREVLDYGPTPPPADS